MRTLGIENVLLLLNSGTLKLDLNPTQFAQSGQTAIATGVRDKQPLPLLSYSFSLLKAAHYNEYLLRSFEDVRRDLFGVLGNRDLMRLEGAILNSLSPLPAEPGFPAMRAFTADLRANSPIIKMALVMRLRLAHKIELSESDISVRLIPIDETDFATESNLESLGLEKVQAHGVLQSALLAVGGLNLRIEDMRNYDALSGSIDEELSLFSGKFDFLRTSLSPNRKEQDFERVLQIRKLPAFNFDQEGSSFDVEQFLEVRKSKECVAFRDWLRRTHSMSDDEIAENVNSVSARLGPMIHGTTGKAVRFVISAGLGAIPGVGSLLGLGLSALDTFVVDKLCPISGPTLFLGKSYPSLFESGKNSKT